MPRLLGLLAELYAETEGFLDRTQDAQIWYNRGYANGLASALGDLGYGAAVRAIGDPDPPEIAAGVALLPWGKAYVHGFEMGRRETMEVMEPPDV